MTGEDGRQVIGKRLTHRSAVELTLSDHAACADEDKFNITDVNIRTQDKKALKRLDEVSGRASK